MPTLPHNIDPALTPGQYVAYGAGHRWIVKRVPHVGLWRATVADSLSGRLNLDPIERRTLGQLGAAVEAAAPATYATANR